MLLATLDGVPLSDTGAGVQGFQRYSRRFPAIMRGPAGARTALARRTH